jgi:hypothetical protein
MSAKKHYFIEQMPDEHYALRAKGSHRATGIFETQLEAITRAHELNPDDHPEVERVRDTATGDRGKWRGR